MRVFMIGLVSVLVAISCGKSREKDEPRPKAVEPSNESMQMGEPGAEEPRAGAPAPGAPKTGEQPESGEQTGMAPQADGKDLVAVARGAGQFTTLLAALAAADMMETLAGPGPFTVFAPTDEAFAKIPKEQLDALLADKEKLRAVLANHVVSGKVVAHDIAAGKLEKATMLSGNELPIDTKDGVKIGSARVIKADVMASNGVIHVIDTVLLPGAGGDEQARADESPDDQVRADEY